jgi:hypothetical protein
MARSLATLPASGPGAEGVDVTLLRIDEAVQLLNCSRNTVLRLAQRGAIERVDCRIPGSKQAIWRFTRLSIVKFVTTRLAEAREQMAAKSKGGK